MILVISGIILTFGIALLMAAMKFRLDDGLIILSILFIMCGLFFGFGIMANCLPVKTFESFLKPDAITRNSVTVIAAYENIVVQSSEAVIYNSKDEDLKIIKIEHMNSYNRMLPSRVQYGLRIKDKNEANIK